MINNYVIPRSLNFQLVGSTVRSNYRESVTAAKLLPADLAVTRSCAVGPPLLQAKTISFAGRGLAENSRIGIENQSEPLCELHASCQPQTRSSRVTSKPEETELLPVCRQTKNSGLVRCLAENIGE